MKIVEKYSAEILILILLAIVLSGCQTVREMNMSGGQKRTQCNYVNR